MDSSACTSDQGASKAFYICLETDVSGSTECVWAQSVALPDVVANKMECLLLKVG